MTRRRYPTAPLVILLWSVLSSGFLLLGVVVAADGTTTSNYYSILEVDPKADAKSIKKAYRKLALRWHPDKHRSDEDKEEATEQFTLINEAFETLGDEERRKEYDAGLRQERQRGSGSGSGNARGGSARGSNRQSQQARYDYDAYQETQRQQQQYQQQQQQYQYQYGYGRGPESYYYNEYQEPMYEQQAKYNAYTAHSYRGPHRDPYEQFHSFFSGEDDDDEYYDEYDLFFGSGRRSQQQQRERYQRHRRPRPQSLDDWLDLAMRKARQALQAVERAVDRGIDWIGHAIVDAARDIFEPDDDDRYDSWDNSRRPSGSNASRNNNSKWNKQRQKAKQWWDKVKVKSRQWSQKVQRSKHTRKLKRTAKKVKSKVSRWIRNVDQSIDRQKLEFWARRVQQKASHISQNIGRAINAVLFGEGDDDGSEENYAYSSKSSRTFYQNGVETTVQTFHDVLGNRIEEVYLNGMLSERYVNGVPDAIY